MHTLRAYVPEVMPNVFVCGRRRIHACHMRRRIHACHMRRRIHAYAMLMCAGSDAYKKI